MEKEVEIRNNEQDNTVTSPATELPLPNPLQQDDLSLYLYLLKLQKSNVLKDQGLKKIRDKNEEPQLLL